MSTSNGGPAFPVPEQVYHEYKPKSLEREAPFVGMSMRDYFAAAALPTVLSNPASIAMVAEQIGETHEEAMAAICYSFADAMLAERAKGGAK